MACNCKIVNYYSLELTYNYAIYYMMNFRWCNIITGEINSAKKIDWFG